MNPIGSDWRRAVIKLGTSTLTAGSGSLNPPRMVDLVRQLAKLRAEGVELVLVSSGAQQAGRERLGYPKERRTIPFKQMLAAVGQGRLMNLWEQYFELYGIVVAQVLLTREDIEDRRRYLNLRDTFESLLEHDILPIVNENDAVATDEIKVGENDSLSAMVSTLVEADALVLLTDTDGLYTSDPSIHPEAQLIGRIDVIDEHIYRLATGTQTEMGTGGMYTKIVAAAMGVRTGTSVVIANGGRDDVLAGIWSETVPTTLFPARITPREGRKRWLLTQRDTAGSVVIDGGAAKAISMHGTSLLPVGIVEVDGVFERGEIIGVRTTGSARGSGTDEVARGLCNYGSKDLGQILGQQSGDILEILGYDYGPEFIHRDKLVLL